jgi:hypothetical protein
MRAPERRERRTNLLDLICELIEQPQSRISSSILEFHDSAADCLIEIGLLRKAAKESATTGAFSPGTLPMYPQLAS